MYRVRYHLDPARIKDVPGELRARLASSAVLLRVKAGAQIAIAVGSRGIANQPILVKTLIDELKRVGARPFLVPAMGSHAGADPAGQKALLEGLGLTEQFLGVEIRSSMEVIQVGQTDSGLPVYADRQAHEADAVVLLNRVKAHPSFVGEIESGLLKMAAIGLGKQRGAEVCHELGFEKMSQHVVEIAGCALARVKILFGVAVLENAFHDTAEIHVLPAEEIARREPALLAKAKQLMARVPFKELEAIIVDRIGKDISGTGLDTNVVGRYHTGYGSGGPSVTRISVLDLTDASHGNGNGLGIADFTTRRVFDKFDFAETYPNSLTSNVPVSVKIPMVLPDDRSAIRAAIKTCLIWDKTKVRLVRIRDTLSLSEMEVSEALLPEVGSNPRLEVLAGPYQLAFDAAGNLF
jgi:hypothetical protein